MKRINLAYKKNTKDKLAWILVLFFIVLLFQLAASGWSRYFEYIGFTLVFILSMIATKQQMIFIVMYLLPSNQYINIGGTSVVTILVVLHCIKFVLFQREKLYIPHIMIGLILIIYSLTFHGLESISYSVKIILYLIFARSIFTENNRSLYINCIKYLSLGIVLTSITTLIVNPELLVGRFSLTVEQSTNTLGILSAFAFANMLMMIQNKLYKLEKSWLFISIVLLGVGFLTQSRSFLLGIGVASIWVILFFFYKNNYKQKMVKIFLGGLLLISVLVLISPSLLQTMEMTIERVVSPRGGDISNNRFDIWSYYFEVLKDVNLFLFGAGTNISSGINMLPHNMYIEQIYHFGLIGNVLIVLLFIITIVSIYKNDSTLRISFYGFLPLFIMLITGFVTHSFIAGADTVRFILAIIAIGVYKNARDFNMIVNTEAKSTHIAVNKDTEVGCHEKIF